MRFAKMHGQGNDFIVAGGRDIVTEDLHGLSVRACDRHRGIGADGLIVIEESGTCDFRMRIFNPDGSEPEMCGNGIRCAAKFFLERTAPERIRDVNRMAVSVETLAGARNITADCRDGVVGEMTVNMGVPKLTPKEIPVIVESDRAVGITFEAAGHKVTATCVSMGNPHAVIFVEQDPFGMDISELGPAVENHPLFPRRTNVEFVKVAGPGDLIMRVWERGAGETLACGTGACATLAAAVLNGFSGRSAVVHLAGGDLNIEWRESGEVFMTGTASIVFDGVYDESD